MSNILKLSLTKEEIGEVVKEFYKNCEIEYTKQLSRGLMSLTFEIKIKNPSKIFIIKMSNLKGIFSLAKEVYVIKLLGKHKIHCPNILYFDYSKKRYPFEILIIDKFKGKNLNEIWNKIDKKNKLRISFKLGELLALINSIKFKRFALINGYKKFKYYNNIYEDFHSHLTNDYVEYVNEGIIDKRTYERIKKVFLKYKKFLKSLRHPVLTHNDLWFDHVFVKKVGKYYKIEGIIDFGFAFIFPKEADFVKPQRWIFDKGEDIKASFMAGYQTIIKLDKNFDTTLSLFRVLYDTVFISRLHRTKQYELANKYKKVLNGFLAKLEKEKIT